MSSTPNYAPGAGHDARCKNFVRDFCQNADLRHLTGIRGFARTLSENWNEFDEKDRRDMVKIMSSNAELLWPELDRLRQEAKQIVDSQMDSAAHAVSRPLPIAIRQLPGAEDLPLPSYKTDGAAGMDLYASVAEPLTLAPGARAAVPTGIAVAVPPGYEAQVRARSGLAKNFGIACVNAPGTIDSDYRGEIAAILVNLGDEPFTLARGERIAQLVVAPVVRVQWEPVETLDETARGAGGFGHTGRQ